MARKALIGVGSGNNQRGNLNALRNGTRIPMRRLSIGSTGIPRVDKAVKAYRHNLEQVVLCEKGLATVEQIVSVANAGKGKTGGGDWQLWKAFVESHLTPEDAHLIDLATGATGTIELNRWLLRERDKRKISVADIRACSANITKSQQTRLSAIQQLKLHDEQLPPWVMDSGVVDSSNG